MRQFRNDIGLQTCGNPPRRAGVVRQSETTSGPRRAVIRRGGQVSENKTGFTIVELLTVMSIIVVLISLLVPALNMAKRYATNVKQQAQFHGIAVAMQLFSSEFEGYPDSDYLDEASEQYPGATRLCEAVVGQDLLGYHPASRFRSDGGSFIDLTSDLYDEGDWAPDEWVDNLRARKGPYLQLEKANAYKLEDIYGTAGTEDLEPGLFVLCDEYARVKHPTTGKRIGMPVLYYKADTAGIRHDPNSNYLPIVGDDRGQIYNYLDNDYLVELGMPWNPSATHPLHTEPERFYESTKNKKITITDGRPYRADSYILMSAGFDGLYGTPDDKFNFEP